LPVKVIVDGVFLRIHQDSHNGSVIAEREKKPLHLLEQPRTLEEILACIIYRRPREPAAFFGFGKRAHMIKHLEHLQKRGMVLSGNGYYRR
jgi:hypothetical protein